MIVATFAAHTLMQQIDTDEKLLALKPRMAPNVRLEQVCVQHQGEWRAESLTLQLVSGFPFHMNVQPLVAEFLVTCDGERTAGEAIEAFARTANAPRRRGSEGMPRHHPQAPRTRLHGPRLTPRKLASAPPRQPTGALLNQNGNFVSWFESVSGRAAANPAELWQTC